MEKTGQMDSQADKTRKKAGRKETHQPWKCNAKHNKKPVQNEGKGKGLQGRALSKPRKQEPDIPEDTKSLSDEAIFSSKPQAFSPNMGQALKISSETNNQIDCGQRRQREAQRKLWKKLQRSSLCFQLIMNNSCLRYIKRMARTAPIL